METVLEIVRKAIANGDFEQLLRGEEGYDLDTPYMAPAPLPTDWDALLTKGIYEVYRGESGAGIDKKLETALLDLTSDVRGTYCALNVFWHQIRREESKLAPFVLGKDRIIKNLKEALAAHKEEMVKDYRWMGQTEKKGLWGEVLRISRIIKEDHGISLVDEEL